jgi:hypothetical protein
MKRSLASLVTAVALSGCAGGVATSTTGIGQAASVISAASPVLTVLSVTQTAAGILGSGVREYTVRVRSTDADQREALRQAFAEACSVTFGSTVASEQESNNGALTRDNVVSYTACYVKDHAIESKTNSEGGVTLIVKVTVTSNKLSGRLLGDSRVDADFNGEQHANRIETYQTSMTDSDRLVEAVVRDFPQRAYQIKLAKTTTKINPDRTGFVLIDYLVQLDPRYVDALQELFSKTGKIPAGKIMGAYPIGKWGLSTPVAEIVVPGFMTTTTYQFDDQQTVDRIVGGLNRQQILGVYARFGTGDGAWRPVWCNNAIWSTDRKIIDLSTTGGRLNLKQVWYQLRLDFKNQQELARLRDITEIQFKVMDHKC